MVPRGAAPADGLLSVVNTASSCTFEGIADNGLRVLDWIESDDDRFSADDPLPLGDRHRCGVAAASAWLAGCAWKIGCAPITGGR